MLVKDYQRVGEVLGIIDYTKKIWSSTKIPLYYSSGSKKMVITSLVEGRRFSPTCFLNFYLEDMYSIEIVKEQ